MITITDDTDKRRFELVVDGELAALVVYGRNDAIIALTHTETMEGFGGQGYATRLVEHIIVDERCRVDHLDNRRKRVVLVALVAARARGEEDEGRAQTLAAAADDVFGDLAYQHDFGAQRVAQHEVDLRHFGGEERLDEF